MVLSDQAVAAVRAIGPAAVPTLLAWLRASDSSFSRSAKILLEWRLKLPVRVPTNQDKRMRAMYGFRALGSAASAAFPELVAIALDSPDEWQRGDAINALTDSDADTMRRIAGSLKSPDREVRLRAVFALSCIRIAPDEVLPPRARGSTERPGPPGSHRGGEGNRRLRPPAQGLRGLAHTPRLQDAGPRGPPGWKLPHSRRAFLSDLEAAAGDNDPEVRAAVAEAIQRVRGSESPPTH